MNYFVEGLQGSGKSTLAKKVSEKHTECKHLEEGDYSPIELSWCAYLSKEEYERVLNDYPEMNSEIKEKSHEEGDKIVICYTKIRTDKVDFYKDLERFEIYNDRVSFEVFRDIVLSRYKNWKDDNYIFECSLFQNIVEDMILFRDKSDEEIIAFYKEIKEALGEKDIKILYIKTEPDDIKKNLEAARKERVDDKGNEVWYGMLCGFFNNCLYAKKNGLKDGEGLIKHWNHRQELELRICEEVFPGQYMILPSKAYGNIEI